MMVIVLGVLSGLWAAFFQSLSYLATRHFLHVHGGGIGKLMALAHIWMGATCLAVLPFALHGQSIPWSHIALPLFGVAFFYIVGQFGMVFALQHAQPSQAAPMLALKLLVLAGLSIAIRHEAILPQQWGAIGCCLAGTFVLNYTRDRMPGKAMAALLCTCVCYGISDWSIGYLVHSFGADMPRWRAIAASSLLCYTVCGLAAVPFLPLYGSRKKSDWYDALPYSLAWLVAMFGLFTCFALMGVIYGNILQNTRSIMGVFLAALLTQQGFTHIEHMKSRAMFLRRLVAAMLMTVAALLWFAGKQPA